MMQPSTPRDEHRFLQRLVGDWVVTATTGHAEYDPSKPDTRWTETVRPVGDLWVVGESAGPMPDGSRATMVITLGFDAALGHYVGTWIGSMMDRLWVYRGWVEPDGRTLTLEAEGPDFDDPAKTAVYRDVIAFVDDDHRRFSGSVRRPDGSFQTFMTHDYRRA